MVAHLFANYTVVLGESEMMLQKAVDEFHRVCKRRKLKVNVVLERPKDEIISFALDWDSVCEEM